MCASELSGRRLKKSDKDEYLNRPRFLAVSEFGPRSIIYHEGSRDVVDRVILPADAHREQGLITSSAKNCTQCGHLHPLVEGVANHAWLAFIDGANLRLPDDAQHQLDGCNTVADFYFSEATSGSDWAGLACESHHGLLRRATTQDGAAGEHQSITSYGNQLHRLTWLRRAAKANAARMSSRSRSS